MTFTLEDARAMSPKQLNRFYSKIKKGTNNECWLWQAYKNKDGYGHLGLTINGEFKMVLAHRLAYLLFYNEEIPEQISHLCNCPSCVNPLHLMKATHLENHRYRVECGRSTKPKESLHRGATLDKEKVSKIKDLLVNSEMRIIEIAKMFGVHKDTIYSIKRNKTWTHVPWPIAH